MLALGTEPDTISIWRITEYGETKNYKEIILSDYQFNYPISISPDGNSIASGMRDGIYIWQLQSGALINKLDTDRSDYSDISWSPDSKSLVSTTIERGIEVWDIENEVITFAPRHISGNFSSMAWSSVENLIAAGTEEGYIYLLQVPSGKVARILDQNYIVNSVNFSPNGQYLAAGNVHHLVRIWNLDGTVLKEFKGFGLGSTGVSFFSGRLFIRGKYKCW